MILDLRNEVEEDDDVVGHDDDDDNDDDYMFLPSVRIFTVIALRYFKLESIDVN